MPSALPYGNINKFNLVDITWSPAQVAATTSAAQTVAVPGVIPGQDFVLTVSKPTEQLGLAVASARASALNTVTVVFVNETGAPITPTAGETYTFAVVRRDGPANRVMS